MATTAEPIRVLHIDDEPDFANLAAEFLERLDNRLSVETAETAREGLERLEETDIDCVVSDYEMPGQNGVEFLQSVRQKHPELPFILFTGKGSEEVASKAISAGVTDYLQKETGTSQYDILANRISNVVEQRRSRVEVAEKERWTNRLLEHSSDYLFVVDKSGEISYISPSVEHVLGYDPEEIMGASAFEFTHPDDIEKATETFVETLERPNEDVTVEFRAKHADGGHRWLEVRGRNLLDDPVIGGVLVNARDVTERKVHEQEIEEYRTLVETVGDPMYILDTEGVITMVNEAAVDHWGYDREEFVGTHARELMPDEDYDRGTELIMDLLESDEDQWRSYEMRSITKDGDTVVNENKIAVLTEDGEFAGSVGVVRDISERKDYERTLTTLHDSATRILHADSRTEASDTVIEIAEQELDHPYGSVFLWDEDNRVLRAEVATEQSRQKFGEPPTFEAGEGIVGEAFDRGERIVLSDAQSDHRALEDGSTTIRGYCVIPIDSYGVFVLGSPQEGIFDERSVQLASILASHLAAALDRIDRERKLSRLQKQFRSLMHTESKVETARLVVNAAEEIIGLRLNGAHLLDESGDVMEGLVMSDAVLNIFDEAPNYHRDSEPGSSAAIIWDTYRSGEPLYIGDTREFDRLDDEPPTRSVMIHPLENHGVFIASDTDPLAFDELDRSLFEVLATALTAALDRVEREQTLRQQRADLQRQNERLDQFASVLSHDLRNPLSVAEGRLELALEECDSEHLRSVAEAHHRMGALVSDMLELARAGETIGETQAVELSALVEACWRNVETEAARLVIETDAIIEADETRLRQMFENLLRNAVEHGGAEVTITVGDLPGGFYVEDNGPGIAEDSQVNVLEPGHSSTGDRTGFGLSIVREIAEAHGWEINVTSSSDGGARFEFKDV